MKYIKVDKDNNIIAYLNSDIPQHNKEYIKVKDFPNKDYNSKFINGKIVRGNPIQRPVMIKKVKFDNQNTIRIKNLEDRIMKIEQLLKIKT